MSMLFELLADLLGLLFLESAWEDYGDFCEKSSVQRFWFRLLFLIGLLIYFFTAFVLVILDFFAVRVIMREGVHLTSGVILLIGLILTMFISSKLPVVLKNGKWVLFFHSVK